MKIIFLDIDGVLNCENSQCMCRGVPGIDDDKLERLNEIVKCTDAQIVLISSWKSEFMKGADKQQSIMGEYLDTTLRKKGLIIFDKTEDDFEHRGQGILNWLLDNKTENYIILDNEDFDYKESGLEDKVIKTSSNVNGGLQDFEMKKAIKKLKMKEANIEKGSKI